MQTKQEHHGYQKMYVPEPVIALAKNLTALCAQPDPLQEPAVMVFGVHLLVQCLLFYLHVGCIVLWGQHSRSEHSCSCHNEI